MNGANDPFSRRKDKIVGPSASRIPAPSIRGAQRQTPRAAMRIAGRSRSRKTSQWGGGDAGYLLLEVLVALFLMTIIVLAMAQLVVLSLAASRAAVDYTEATYLASEKMEELVEARYTTLDAGGSLDGNTTGFFDNPDVDGDEVGDYERRWEITDLGDRKQIRVRLIAERSAYGPPREVTLVTLVAPS